METSRRCIANVEEWKSSERGGGMPPQGRTTNQSRVPAKGATLSATAEAAVASCNSN
eukprot:CAMPEP_0177379472 /NCGR_PEP_ID=MMETSP0368-20130122/46944_1 /TAXON_ID=447022 ORGANISM="Scrippsiella hangoei-like, Strain SHHI-4" /NCGR_SAMPLE_ID=MMETSP0368 /ASSEMBLY_ACC=CAM_ASM_000363 /LENGTH=56 /DNA_ID=CAMNT_0018843607 /DNA_START=199 /DNA_END=369 /DNA_ORIENTATION=+